MLLKNNYLSKKKIIVFKNKNIQKYNNNKQLKAHNLKKFSHTKYIPLTFEEKLLSRQNSFTRLLKHRGHYPQFPGTRYWFPRSFKHRAQKGFNFRPFFLLWHSYHKSNVMNKLKQFLKHVFHKFGWFYRFRIDEKKKKFRKRSDFLKRKMNILRIRLFYGLFSHKKYVRLLRNKAKANDYQTFLYGLMERRLDVILFRSCFCKSIYSAQQMVRHGHVTVDNIVVRNFYSPIKFFQKISFSTKEIAIRIQYSFFLQLKTKRLRFFPVSYLIVNYLFMFCYLRPIINPKKEIAVPLKSKHRFLTIK